MRHTVSTLRRRAASRAQGDVEESGANSPIQDLSAHSVMKYLTRTQYLAIASLSSSALDLMKDALGIGDCIALIRAT
ncbi:hypothetical protein GCU60_17280 [Blastococcus saxobsidens]|uniref:Uncharacterized protein n=1 Tax=Blastococcus saxobsidens TaxID=138336 RepID=A0A6L9W5W5_9ACTN|nr:hypothetical protein [Blastococcus saxobsidens]NEK87496.1 hypothetical protein [Blastococcus saxobsidens]